MNSSAGSDSFEQAGRGRRGLKTVPTVNPWDPRNLIAFRRDTLDFLTKSRARYGDIFKFHIFGHPMIMINHPDYVEHVLVHRADKYTKQSAFIFELTAPVLGNGLIRNPGGPAYTRQRNMMQPTFRPNTVPLFVQNMIDETVLMMDRWRPLVDTDRVANITDDVGQTALRIVTRSLFSADVGESARDFELAFAEANNVIGTFFRRPLSMLGLRRKRLRTATEQMKSFISAFVERRIANQEVRDDLLGMLMRATYEDDGATMSMKQLHDEVLNLVIAAFETTTSGISWAFYLIATHPEVERRFLEEIDTKLQGRAPTYGDLNKLTYTRMIVDETLRLYSPAYQTMRRSVEEDDMHGYRIPANMDIYLNSHVTHRHPAFWDDAEKFDPERFTPERSAGRPKHAYFPFGSGPRVCIGKYFALAELQLILATVAQRFRLVVPPDQAPMEAEQLITLHPKDGVRLLVRSR
ncbi:cytochrome P450 [Pendulispora albinea]|uniref:Cytochrome P450 n=1 Tax=Pendulispora albinea TaxID=2741071 RepID=A0ABZ2MAR0_9BACT